MHLLWLVDYVPLPCRHRLVIEVKRQNLDWDDKNHLEVDMCSDFDLGMLRRMSVIFCKNHSIINCV